MTYRVKIARKIKKTGTAQEIKDYLMEISDYAARHAQVEHLDSNSGKWNKQPFRFNGTEVVLAQ